MEESLRRDIILDNYNNPQNKKVPDSLDGYIKFNSRNNSCIDNLDIYLKVENNIIQDIKYEAQACVICISSTSILSGLLIGKNIDEATDIINNYHNMINEQEYNDKIISLATVFCDIYKQPSRKNCATLFTKGLEKQLDNYQNNEKN